MVIENSDSFKDWIIRLIKGIFIGVGGILPGLSGGVLAVIFKVYDPLIEFLAHPMKDFKANVRYFLPVGIGLILGIISFAFLVKKAFGSYEAVFTCLFIGFVLGTFPSLYQTAGRKGRSGSDILLMVVTAVILTVLMVVGGQKSMVVNPNVLVWIGAGFLVGLGVIVPGLSPSNFLIYFGLYEPMSAGISELNMAVIIPLLIGIIASVLLLARLVNALFARHYSKMYHFILGTVLGSSIALFPTVVFPAFSTENMATMSMNSTTMAVLCIVMLIIGTLFSYWFSQLEARVSHEDLEG